jgi:hypothetical protein
VSRQIQCSHNALFAFWTYELAETGEDAGRIGEALEKYRSILDADPDNIPAKEAVQRLSQRR